MSESNGDEMEVASVEAVGERLAAGLTMRFSEFEDRMVELEQGLRDEVGRIRSSVQVVDLLADEVRRALAEHRPDDALLHRLDALESLLRSTPTSGSAGPHVDLEPVLHRIDQLAQDLGRQAPDLVPLREALADVLDSVAAESTDARTERAAVRAALADLREAVDETVHERLGELAQASSQHAAGTRTIIEAIDSLLDRADGQTPAVDLTPVLGRLDELAGRTGGPAPDLGPLHTSIGEVLDALTQQIDEGRAATRSTLDAIAIVNERVDGAGVDLEPLRSELHELRAAVHDTRPDLEPLRTELHELRAVVHDTRPDLDPLRADLHELRTAVHDTRPDLGPVLERIDTLAGAIEEQRPDPTLVTAALADLRTHLDDTRPDLRAPLDALLDRFDAIDRRIDGATPDLEPLRAELHDLRTAVHDGRPDLTPVLERIDDLRTALPAAVADAAPDLQPIHGALAEIVDALAQQIDEAHAADAETRSGIERLTRFVEESRVDLAPVTDAVGALREHYDETRPDLSAIVGALTAMRAQLLETINDRLGVLDVDLSPVVDAVRSSRDEVGADVSDARHAVDRVLDVLAEHSDARRTADEDLRLALGETRRELQPLAEGLSALQAGLDERTPDLEPIRAQLAALADASAETSTGHTDVLRAVEALREQVDAGPDLEPVIQRVDTVAERVDTVGSSLQEALASNALDPRALSEDLAALRETVLASRPDLLPVRSALDEILGALAQGITETRNTGDRVERIVAEIDTTPDLRPVDDAIAHVREAIDAQARAAGADAELLRSATAEIANGLRDTLDAISPMRQTLDAVRVDAAGAAEAVRQQPDLQPLLAAVDQIRADLDVVRSDVVGVRDEVGGVRDEVGGGRARAEEIAATLRSLADAVESTQDQMARADSIAQIASRLDALDGAVHALRSSEDLREAELRLGRRVDASGEALRARIDDQRVLADSLAANVSQLNAALTKASEEPQQLRRDLDRILEQLAERMGAAMRDLRDELGSSAEEPLALRSSVEAGLDRISGRFQTDAGRILDAVATAQEDADGRLRRIDAQVTELRRTIDRVQRDAAMRPPEPELVTDRE